VYASIVGYSAVTGAQLLLTALNATDDRVSGGVIWPAAQRSLPVEKPSSGVRDSRVAT
jgi:hypothetical protein